MSLSGSSDIICVGAEEQNGDMNLELNYTHLLIMNHDMKILRL